MYSAVQHYALLRIAICGILGQNKRRNSGRLIFKLNRPLSCSILLKFTRIYASFRQKNGNALNLVDFGA